MDASLPVGETSESASDQPQAAPEDKHPALEQLNQDFSYLDDLLDMLQVPDELDTGSSTGSLQSAAAARQDAVGNAFIGWLRDGIHTHRLAVNGSKARVDTVDGT
ncbi:conjugal transfer nickase/helicase domain-containing protein [Pseudomonas helleri]|uniref:Putative conjugal transfer nickase/helicase TraI C-terminal domain-containing protein n=1 Tax=Pseudomonas helleri TaxID=1608996 RepID=A0A7X2C638_9PSED|nr:hypothetical protein [Pseudomonas helleri]MQT92511.1 hypothetical protein [Pseudomonas helleri]